MSKIATTIEQGQKLLKLGLDPATADLIWLGRPHYIKPNEETKDFILVERNPKMEVRDGDFLAWSLSALIDLLPMLFQDNKTGKVQKWGKNIEQALDSKDYDAFSDFYPAMLHGNKIAFGYMHQGNVLFVDDGGEMGGYPLTLGVYGDWVDAAHCTLCWLLEHRLIEQVVHEPIIDEDEDD